MTLLSEVKGWSPIIHSLAQEVGLVTAAVYGAVWRYCQMESRVCAASHRTIADDLGLDHATVLRHIKKLCKNGYLKDETPGLRNVPHTYSDTGKVSLTGKIEARTGVLCTSSSQIETTTGAERTTTGAERTTTGAERTTTGAESHLNRVFKRDSKKDSKKQSTTPHFEPLTVAIATICKFNLGTLLRVTAKELTGVRDAFAENGITPAQVLEFDEWRRGHHWSRATAPTLKQIGEYWGQYEQWVKEGRPAPQLSKNGAYNDKRTARHSNSNSPPVSRATGLGEWTAEDIEFFRQAGVPLPGHGQGDGELSDGNVAAPG